MKPLFVFGTLVCAVACMSLQSFGAESAVVYEQFNYTPGIFTYGSATGPAATGTGLAGNYRLELNAGTGYSSNYVDAGSLAYGGLFVTNANRLRWGAVSGGSVNYLWARLTTSASNALNIASGRQTNWMSYLLTPNTWGDTVGVDLTRESSGITTIFGVSLTRSIVTNLQLRYNNANVAQAACNVTGSETYLLVGRLAYSTSGGNFVYESGKAWLMPSSAAASIEATETWLDNNAAGSASFTGGTGTGGQGFRQINQVRIRPGAQHADYNCVFDEIRIGTNIVDVVKVVPEPATGLVLLLGALLRRRA
jgi:hypothetical protein